MDDPLSPANFAEMQEEALPSQFHLSHDEVHIWRIPLIQTDAGIQRLARILSPDELERANRFHFERDLRRFTVSRGFLRILLGLYLSTRPDQIRFQYNPYGKPGLSGENNTPAIQFNLSHSDELALLAVTSDREVGIDVEYIRPIADADQIAARNFSPSEYSTIQTLPETEKLKAFFNGWTRKEAYIKAIGDGLSRPLGDFEVTLAPGEEPRLLIIRGFPDEEKHWSLHAFCPLAGYTAALVVEGKNLHYRSFCISKNETLLNPALGD